MHQLVQLVGATNWLLLLAFDTEMNLDWGLMHTDEAISYFSDRM